MATGLVLYPLNLYSVLECCFVKLFKAVSFFSYHQKMSVEVNGNDATKGREGDRQSQSWLSLCVMQLNIWESTIACFPTLISVAVNHSTSHLSNNGDRVQKLWGLEAACNNSQVLYKTWHINICPFIRQLQIFYLITQNQTQSNSKHKGILCPSFLQNLGLQDKNKFVVVWTRADQAWKN